MEIFTDLAHLQFVKKIIGIQIVATFFILVYLIKTDKKWKFNCILKQFRNICFSYLDLYPNHWKLRRNIVQCTRYNSSKSDKIWDRKCSINLCSKILKISLPAMLHFIFNLDLSPWKPIRTKISIQGIILKSLIKMLNLVCKTKPPNKRTIWCISPKRFVGGDKKEKWNETTITFCVRYRVQPSTPKSRQGR